MPQFKAYNLWPIPVYESSEPVKTDWLNYIKSTPYERMKIGNGDISIDRYILESMPDLKDKIMKHCEVFTKKYIGVAENAKFYMQNSWGVKHLPEDSAHSHTHGGSLISGVYYLQSPEGSGNISFSKDYSYTNMFHQSVRFDYDDINNINCESYTIDVEDGIVLLFPSHLSHSVEKNNSKQDRYSLAFNFYVRGKFGKEEYQLEIK